MEFIRQRNQEGTFLTRLELRPKGALQGVFTTADISKGAVIVYLQGEMLDVGDRYSIQIDAHTHISRSGLIDDELCHSCDANARIEFPDLSIRAKRDIRAGEEVTINYCATEEVSANPFHCTCGSKQCYGFMNGFKNLTLSQQEVLKDDLSPFLKEKYRL